MGKNKFRKVVSNDPGPLEKEFELLRDNMDKEHKLWVQQFGQRFDRGYRETCFLNFILTNYQKIVRKDTSHIFVFSFVPLFNEPELFTKFSHGWQGVHYISKVTYKPNISFVTSATMSGEITVVTFLTQGDFRSELLTYVNQQSNFEGLTSSLVCSSFSFNRDTQSCQYSVFEWK